MRLIDADAFKHNWLYEFDHKRKFTDLIDEQPTIDPPLVQGEWVGENWYMKCNICGAIYELENTAQICPSTANFCPNCGAKMKEN